MNRHLTTLLVVAMLGGASHAWAQKPAAAVLSEAQLKALLSGGMTAKITGAARPNTASRTGTVTYQKNGTARFSEGAATPDHIGSWRIEGNKFCTKYTDLGSGCFNVQKLGETRYKLVPLDGLLESTWDVTKK